MDFAPSVWGLHLSIIVRSAKWSFSTNFVQIQHLLGTCKCDVSSWGHSDTKAWAHTYCPDTTEFLPLGSVRPTLHRELNYSTVLPIRIDGVTGEKARIFSYCWQNLCVKQREIHLTQRNAEREQLKGLLATKSLYSHSPPSPKHTHKHSHTGTQKAENKLFQHNCKCADGQIQCTWSMSAASSLNWMWNLCRMSRSGWHIFHILPLKKKSHSGLFFKSREMFY